MMDGRMTCERRSNHLGYWLVSLTQYTFFSSCFFVSTWIPDQQQAYRIAHGIYYRRLSLALSLGPAIFVWSEKFISLYMNSLSRPGCCYSCICVNTIHSKKRDTLSCRTYGHSSSISTAYLHIFIDGIMSEAGIERASYLSIAYLYIEIYSSLGSLRINETHE
ncbi:hypothetical protein F4814DRAFT_273421 [Daldinia grandis]|nr:hypothetical protein F4814DRAFT_273421 [Daldinia grandis]